MSAQTSREQEEQNANEPEPACDTTLTGDTTRWQERPAASYPPEYPRLCTDECCFGGAIPPEDWNEDGTADWDHTQVTDMLVCSTQRGTSRRMHLPEGVEVENE